LTSAAAAASAATVGETWPEGGGAGLLPAPARVGSRPATRPTEGPNQANFHLHAGRSGPRPSL